MVSAILLGSISFNDGRCESSHPGCACTCLSGAMREAFAVNPSDAHSLGAGTAGLHGPATLSHSVKIDSTVMVRSCVHVDVLNSFYVVYRHMLYRGSRDVKLVPIRCRAAGWHSSHHAELLRFDLQSLNYDQL